MSQHATTSLYKNLRNRHFLAVDLLVFFMVPFLALFIRFDGNVDWDIYQTPVLYAFLVFTVTKLCLFNYLHLYRRYWQGASIDELAYIVFLGMCTLLAEYFMYSALHKNNLFCFRTLPHSLPFLDSIMSLAFIVMIRFSIRFIERADQRLHLNCGGRVRTLIVGAGEAGTMIVKEMQRCPHLKFSPVAFVDDDQEKHHLRHLGIPILGGCRDIPAIVRNYRIGKIIIAMPTASGDRLRQIISYGRLLGVETLTVPGIFEILNGRVSIEKIRKIQIEDLLRREPVNTDTEKVSRLINGKRVLITGAGGSIGSELCRQILKFRPSELILLGHGENSIFEIEQELQHIKKESPGDNEIRTQFFARIADLRFRERIRDIFKEFEPELVFHAAAHKHVPLMEINPQEAVSNNIIGTKNLVDISVESGVQHFISISTDKAVNPTNIMGASKRIAEMILLDASVKTGRFYSAVRFGNVLGSRGSVIRTFQKQLENGGPLTITHPEIRRYFMTIPEAVQLVLQASVLGNGGDIFVLDMGKPVKIIDLARDVIRLSGNHTNNEIGIAVTGLRPGEKLYEELFVKGEVYETTVHAKILIAKNAGSFIPDNLQNVIMYFQNAGTQLTREEIIEKFSEVIPEFQPDESRKAANDLVSLRLLK
ncbi:MAG: polysaccharide biosynthesis protein [Ignavibacteriales bacterium]